MSESKEYKTALDFYDFDHSMRMNLNKWIKGLSAEATRNIKKLRKLEDDLNVIFVPIHTNDKNNDYVSYSWTRAEEIYDADKDSFVIVPLYLKDNRLDLGQSNTLYLQHSLKDDDGEEYRREFVNAFGDQLRWPTTTSHEIAIEMDTYSDDFSQTGDDLRIYKRILSKVDDIAAPLHITKWLADQNVHNVKDLALLATKEYDDLVRRYIDDAFWWRKKDELELYKNVTKKLFD